MQRTVTTATAFAIALIGLSAHAGTVLVTETRSGNAVEVSEMRMQGSNLRTDVNSREQHQSMILTDKAMLVLDHDERTYTVMDDAAMRKIGGQMAQARAQMDAQMAKLPPEQRAMMQRAMAGMSGGSAPAVPRTQYRRTTRSESAAGVPCKVWEGFEGATKTEEVCIAPASAVPGGNELLEGMKKLGQRISKMTQSMGFGGNAMQAVWNELNALGGLPIIQRDYEGAKVTSTSTLKAVRSEAVPATSFAPPAGYRPRQMDMGR